MRNKQDQLLKDAGKSASMADLRAENAELRTDALTAAEDLKQTLKAQEKLTREYRALEEKHESLKDELAKARETTVVATPTPEPVQNETETRQSEAEATLEMFKKFALPFDLKESAIEIIETLKVDQSVIDHVKKCLKSGFFTKENLKEVAEHITDNLDSTAGGLWLCHIQP